MTRVGQSYPVADTSVHVRADQIPDGGTLTMPDRSATRTPVGKLIEILLPLLILALLIALCVQLLIPFVGLLLWTMILAICFYPVHRRLTSRGLSNRLSAAIINRGDQRGEQHS
jgi:hypothetical protein